MTVELLDAIQLADRVLHDEMAGFRLQERSLQRYSAVVHRGEGFAYVLTVLGHDGKVTRVIVDAVKGTVVGER